MMTKNKSAFSNLVTGERKSSEYGTPLDLFVKIDAIFNIHLDPCAFPDNRLFVRYFYTKTDDGLSKPWSYNTFINPPFGTKKGEKIQNWIQKMKKESDSNPSKIYIMLLPARIESRWFQEEIFSDPYAWVYVIKGRLSFYSPQHNKNNDPHPIGSVLYIRGRDILVEQFFKLEKEIPGVFISQVSYSIVMKRFGD